MISADPAGLPKNPALRNHSRRFFHACAHRVSQAVSIVSLAHPSTICVPGDAMNSHARNRTPHRTRNDREGSRRSCVCTYACKVEQRPAPCCRASSYCSDPVYTTATTTMQNDGDLPTSTTIVVAAILLRSLLASRPLPPSSPLL